MLKEKKIVTLSYQRTPWGKLNKKRNRQKTWKKISQHYTTDRNESKNFLKSHLVWGKTNFLSRRGMQLAMTQYNPLHGDLVVRDTCT